MSLSATAFAANDLQNARTHARNCLQDFEQTALAYRYGLQSLEQFEKAKRALREALEAVQLAERTLSRQRNYAT